MVFKCLDGQERYNNPMRPSTSPSPSKLPFIARSLMPREIAANATMALTLGSIEGGLVGVVVKTQFGGVADPVWVNLAVATVAGAPAFANLASLTISEMAEGKDKTAWVSALQALTAVFCLSMAWVPETAWGLWVITALMVGARLAWAGVITLRSAIWRANFPRHVRGQITGRITVIYSLVIALSAGVTGLLMNHWPEVWRVTFPAAGVMGLFAAWRYQRVRIRMGARLRRQELQEASTRKGGQLRQSIKILKQDHWYRRYMMTMFAFGSGNLMVIALLVVLLTEQFGVSRFSQVMITTTLPLLCLSVFTPIWARRLDAVHILDYRATQAWTFVLAVGLFAVSAIFDWVMGFWVGALALGAAFAGGKLGWNLGHNDFASDEQSTLYMGIHVTLTGLRGLFAPLIGVLVYQQLELLGEGMGRFVLLFPLTLTLGGAITFVILARWRRRSLIVPS